MQFELSTAGVIKRTPAFFLARFENVYVGILVSIPLLFFCVNTSYASSKKSQNKKIKTQQVSAARKKIFEAELILKERTDKRLKEASEILDRRVSLIISKYASKTEPQNRALVLEWNQKREAFRQALSDFQSTHQEMAQSLLLQQRAQTFSSISGAAIAAVNAIQSNYAREAVKRAAPYYLRLTGALIKSGQATVEAYQRSFQSAAENMGALSSEISAGESSIIPTINAQTAMTKLSLAAFTLEYSRLDAGLEAGKARDFQQLLISLVPFAGQSSSNPGLQRLIGASEDRRYPDGVLSLFRSSIAQVGTASLTQAHQLLESSNLAASTLALMNGGFEQAVGGEIFKIPGNSSLDDIHLINTYVNSTLYLFPLLTEVFQQSLADREAVASRLITAAAQIQANPSTAQTKLSRLVSDLTQMKNSFRDAASAAQAVFEAAQEDLVSKQSTLETLLAELGVLRGRYKTQNESVPINSDIVYELKSIFEDRALFYSSVIPAFWMKASKIKSGQSGLSRSAEKGLSKCYLILTDEQLMEDEGARSESLDSCLSKAISANSGDGKSILRSIRKTLKKIKYEKVITSVEKDIFGTTLKDYAEKVELNSESLSEE